MVRSDKAVKTKFDERTTNFEQISGFYSFPMNNFQLDTFRTAAVSQDRVRQRHWLLFCFSFTVKWRMSTRVAWPCSTNGRRAPAAGSGGPAAASVCPDSACKTPRRSANSGTVEQKMGVVKSSRQHPIGGATIKVFCITNRLMFFAQVLSAFSRKTICKPVRTRLTQVRSPVGV